MRKNNEHVGLRIAALSQGRNSLELHCSVTDFGEREPHLRDAGFNGDISLRVTADKSDNKVVVALTASAVADCVCDRCLAPLALPLSGSVTVVFTCEVGENDAAMTIDEYRFYNRQSEYLDLTDDVCDALLLAVPMKATCESNPNCAVFQRIENEEIPVDASESTDNEWQEALAKLKQKYSS